MSADEVRPVTRSLACLALGHLDAQRTPCTLPLDGVVTDLVAEVTRLRLVAGETPAEHAAVDALGRALVEVDREQGKTVGEPAAVLAALADLGWALARLGR